MNLFNSIKSLFGGKTADIPELETPPMPEPVVEVPQEVEETPPEPVVEKPVTPPAPKITADTLADHIEACKAALPNCNLSNEEIDKYSSALTTMEQAIRGLHPTVNVDDLMEFLNRVFSSGLILILNCATPMDRDDSIITINDAIKAIPSQMESDVKIAALQLAILLQNAQIYSCNKTVASLKAKRDEYLKAEQKLVSESQAETADSMTDIEKATFDQYEQRIKQLSGQIEGADKLIINYNQRIVMLSTSIDNIRLFPSATNVKESQDEIEEFLQKMPSLAEFAIMVKEAFNSAEEARARAQAEIKELERTMDDTEVILDPEIQTTLDDVFAKEKGTQMNTAQKETEKPQTETEQHNEERPETLLQ